MSSPCLTAVLPGLILGPDAQFDPFQQLVLPGLTACVGRATRSRIVATTGDSWLRKVFAAEHAGAAELTRAYDLPAGEAGHWLRADPVHLRPDRDRVILFPADLLNLTQDEAQALVATLNAQFAVDGMVFHIGAADRWYVRLQQAPAITTTPVEQVRGSNIHAHLPQGRDALYWHRFLNETQMLLYTHPVNDARELAGERTANSVWIWGEGAPAGLLPRSYTQVWADDIWPRSLARAAGISQAGLPAHYAGLAISGAGLVWLDTLAQPAAAGDLHSWRARIAQLDADWLLPLFTAWQSGALDQLTLIMPGPAGGFRLVLDRVVRWRFWRRPYPLTQLAALLRSAR